MNIYIIKNKSWGKGEFPPRAEAEPKESRRKQSKQGVGV